MAVIVAIIETSASDFVANTENAPIRRSRYGFWMLSRWLQEALEASGVSQSELSRRLTEMLGRSIDRAAVNKMVKGARAIAGDELIAIQTITGMEAPSEILVPLKGRVGAGQQVEAIDNGDVDSVPAPRDSRPGTVAVEVSGTSMFPALEDGYLLYYSKHLPPAEMVNRRAVVQLADGRIFVKIIRPGSAPDLWTLQSVNAMFEDMIDQVVEWAAPIDWIRPR
ncbi:LexA family transcriptional regulator [Nitratireductor sp. B36]|uniref:LexA family transcriptional regulator n=1 Tax=Nitratireductor sp. B36 TaxID=2762059 RepID=UPI001E419AB0|nr:LexA family transcriptional regulator [Nitratireductor sp. B36]